MGVHQRIPQDTSQYNNVSIPLKLDQDISVLDNIPATVIELIDCRISGFSKPVKSPKYKNFKLGQYKNYLSNAGNGDIAWLLARFSQKNVQLTPAMVSQFGQHIIHL